LKFSIIMPIIYTKSSFRIFSHSRWSPHHLGFSYLGCLVTLLIVWRQNKSYC
jgi:hypothetical protein